MLYDGRSEAKKLQALLRERVDALTTPPSLAVIAVATHPAITSFISIKKKFGEAIGVSVEEFYYEASTGEEKLVEEIKKIIESKKHTGIIIQLPLPSLYDTQKILDTLPSELDVDILGKAAWHTFATKGAPLPPVAGAIAHVLNSITTELPHKNIVVVGQGRLVGLPTTLWCQHQSITPTIIDITTPEDTRKVLYKNADIVISGIGVPHHLHPDYFSPGVVLIDAGTSEQAGVLAGDCDPRCESVASVMTPVPGGIGPLTVAYLFINLLERAEERERERK